MAGVGTSRSSVLRGVAATALAVLLSLAAAPAAAADRPNFVVVMSDDQSMLTAKLMPTLHKRQWARFDNAVVNNPLCCPSRATILTGLYSDRTGVETNDDGDLFDDSETIATWLEEAGYRTGFVGKYLNYYPWDRGARYVPPGWDRWIALRGRPGFYDYRYNVDGRLRRAGDRKRDYLGRFIGREARKFIDRTAGEEPFLLFLSPYGPHAPSTPDPRDEGTFDGERLPLPPGFNERNVADKPEWVQGLERRSRRDIMRKIRSRAETALSLDRLLRRTIRRLRKAGELDDTYVIYLSDQGYALGEHRYRSKNCAYEACIRTPLHVRGPGIDRGRLITEPAGNADLAPTIAELARVEPPPNRDGISLVPLLEGRRAERDRAILLRNALGPPVVVTPRFWGVRTREHKYVELETGERELYDLRRDPAELRNRAGSAGYAEIEAQLAERLDRLRNR